MLIQSVYIVLYVLGEMITYLLTYTQVFGLKLRHNKLPFAVIFISLSIVHLLILQYVDFESATGMSIFTMLLIPLLLITPIKIKNFLLYPFIIIGIAVISLCASFIFSIVFDTNESQILQGNFYIVLVEYIPVLFLLILMLYKKRHGSQDYQVHLDKRQYIIFIIVVISLFMMLAPIQGLSRLEVESETIHQIGLYASIGSLVLVISTLWQGIVINRDSLLKERNKNYEEYIALQKDYYDNLIRQDETMRRFRHDMNHHISVIKAYASEKNIEQLTAYLDDMIEESSIYSIQDYTGNRGMNAVIENLIHKAEASNIHVSVHRACINTEFIKEIDLCTIISNLFTNAIEECIKIKDETKRKIDIEFGCSNLETYIIIKNTVHQQIKLHNKLLTSKADKHNHGIGLQNVCSAIQKYNGSLTMNCENDWFTAEIILLN